MYKTYFQKSKIFLYPALEIRRGVSVTPIQTYVAWKGHYNVDDAKLCSLYHLRDDQEFKIFEKQKLLGNKLYHDFKHVQDNKGVYVFDFSNCREDWNHFINGRYSKFSEDHKKKVLNWLRKNNTHYAHVESFLYPEKYFHIYSEIVGVDVKILKEVGELCSKWDQEQEILEMSIVDLDIIKKIS